MIIKKSYALKSPPDFIYVCSNMSDIDRHSHSTSEVHQGSFFDRAALERLAELLQETAFVKLSLREPKYTLDEALLKIQREIKEGHD